LAIVVLCALVILPITILALYPFAIFQKFLNLFSVRWYVLHTFVDSFQGCYKDGTEPGTRDYRLFSVVYVLINIVSLIIFSLFLNVLAFAFVGVLMAGVVVATMILKPFKKNRHNLVNAAFALLLMCGCICSMSIDFAHHIYYHTSFFVVIVYIILLFPCLYALLLLACWLYTKRPFIFRSCVRGRGYVELTGDGGDCLSDRILHPKDYPSRNLSSFVTPTF
jgi:hypothetical protein